MSKYNDIDINLWKDYGEIETDSLWIIDKRDNSGAHTGDYHGNFVPQIPRQLFSRYTKNGDWIIDPFMGSGTSLIEAQRMKRNAIGIELQQSVIDNATQRILAEDNESRIISICGDSSTVDLKPVLDDIGIKKVQFVIFHPPYWDIINFSDNPADLSNCATLDEFKNSFGEVIENTTAFLEKNRYCAVVTGDKYANRQVVPLGFHCMNLFLERGFLLKAIIVKNFGETKGKANMQQFGDTAHLKAIFIFSNTNIFSYSRKLLGKVFSKFNRIIPKATDTRIFFAVMSCLTIIVRHRIAQKLRRNVCLFLYIPYKTVFLRHWRLYLAVENRKVSDLHFA